MKRIPLALALLGALVMAMPALAGVCEEWNVLQREVRDGAVERKAAKLKIVELHRQLLATYGAQIKAGSFSFPLQGYGPKSIGGVKGNGFVAAGYNFYDGNRHGGHPAHDIFIRDRNFDSLDDATGQPVQVLSVTDGVVIGTNPSWDYPSEIRGGKYIWIFNPAQERYYYYAHLSQVNVVPGQLVKAGEPIALLGRTGKNAYPHRSPTHVHFMCLAFDGGKMTPHNTYQELLTAELHK